MIHIKFSSQVSKPNYSPKNLLIMLYLDATLAQVRLAMAEEEENKAEAGMSILHNVSESAFILLGMDAQNIQCICITYLYSQMLTSSLYSKTIPPR